MSNRTRQILFFLLFFLVATTSFSLGYLYAHEVEPVPIIIQKNSP